MGEGNVIDPTAERELATLADQINDEHRQVVSALQDGLQHALEAGRLLIQAKEQKRYGSWQGWLKQYFDGTPRTAQRYMRIARELPKLPKREATRVSDLSQREALKVLSTTTSKAKSVPADIRFKVLGRALKQDESLNRAVVVVSQQSRAPVRHVTPKPRFAPPPPPSDEQLRAGIEQNTYDQVRAFVDELSPDYRGAAAQALGRLCDELDSEAETSGADLPASEPQPVSDAMVCAEMAISQMERIRRDDPKRCEAMADVRCWIDLALPTKRAAADELWDWDETVRRLFDVNRRVLERAHDDCKPVIPNVLRDIAKRIERAGSLG